MAKQSRFEKQLNTLNQQMVQMGSMVEQSIEMAVSALVTKDSEKAHNVIEYAADVSNQERQIEGMCMKLLLCQQPVASDLRMISSALKMITDMERIGDHSENLCELAQTLKKSKQKFSPWAVEQATEMRNRVEAMLEEALQMFASRETQPQMAADINRREEIIDDATQELKDLHIERLNQRKCSVVAGTVFMDMLTNLERIADHCTNIAYSMTNQKNHELQSTILVEPVAVR